MAATTSTTAQHTAVALEAVQSGHSDIAMQVSLEMMKTKARGRMPFQKVYMWSGKTKGATNVKYDPDVDGPKVFGAPAILPGPEELLPYDDTKAYLEVGIIISNDPGRYKVAGSSRNKQREEEKRARGAIDRDSNAMRVFIPVTENVAPQAKFYVGCRPTDGRLHPRVVEASFVYFYPEFWRDVDEGKPARQRLVEVTMACKKHAAINNSPVDSDVNPVLPDELPQVVEERPNLTTFVDLNTPLSDESINAGRSAQTLKPDVVKAIHAQLRFQGPDGNKLGDRLRLETADIFLDQCRILFTLFGSSIHVNPAVVGKALDTLDLTVEESTLDQSSSETTEDDA